MKQEYQFENKEEFLAKLKELVQSGVAPKSLHLTLPFHLHEVDEIMEVKPSPIRFFTLFGALAGFITGILLTTLTSLHWPLIGGGKPIVSIPAFIIIMFELTILLGATITFAGFLILSRLPSWKGMFHPVEYGNKFVIAIEQKES